MSDSAVSVVQDTDAPERLPRRQNAYLRPWKPGQSGNPGGRKNPLKEVQALCRDRSLKSARALADIAEDPDEDSARRIVAADKVLTWAFGRPPDYDPASDKPSMVVDLSRLQPAQLSLIRTMIDSGAIRPAEEAATVAEPIDATPSKAE